MKYKKLGKSGIEVSEIGFGAWTIALNWWGNCLLYTSPSPRDQRGSRMPSSA